MSRHKDKREAIDALEREALAAGDAAMVRLCAISARTARI